MDTKLIGTCFSCQNLFCEHPSRIDSDDAMQGCSEWTTQEASDIDKNLRVIVINGD